MQNFDYQTPTRLIFGKGVVEKLPGVMAQFGKKILLTYGGGSIKKIGLYQKVLELLDGYEIVELPGIQPNPKYDPSVLEGVRLCKEHQVDVILSVGGGSVLDCSKAIAAGACYDGDPWDLISYKVKAQAALPIVDIITLAATGSEYDCGGVISRTETNDKIGYMDPLLFPAVSFLDPTYTFTVSRKQTAAGIRLSQALRSVNVMDLDPELKTAAELRIRYPEASVAELAALCDPPVTKSGMYHRLRRLNLIAEGKQA